MTELTRQFIVSASPYSAVNSSCYVASVKFNKSAQPVLLLVNYPEDATEAERVPPTKQKTIADHMEYQVGDNVIDISGTIDGALAIRNLLKSKITDDPNMPVNLATASV